MNEGIKECIINWAEENEVYLSIEDVEGLAISIDMAHEMDMCSTGWTPGYAAETEDQKRIKELKKTIESNETRDKL